MAGDQSIHEQMLEDDQEVVRAHHEYKEALIRAYTAVGEKIASDPDMVEAVSRVLHYQIEPILEDHKNNMKLGEKPYMFSAHQGSLKTFSACLENLTDQSEIVKQVRHLTGEESKED